VVEIAASVVVTLQSSIGIVFATVGVSGWATTPSGRFGSCSRITWSPVVTPWTVAVGDGDTHVPAVIDDGTRFREDLQADSLHLVELVVELEDSYGVRIPDDEAVKIKTVGQAADFVAAHAPETAS